MNPFASLGVAAPRVVSREAVRLPLVALASALLTVSAPPSTEAVAAAEPAPTVDFQRDVRPILSDNCFACHGPDEATREADLRLDTRDGAFSPRPPAGRSNRPRDPAVVPGDASASLLVERITHADAIRRMPPETSNKSLSSEQIDLLKRWVEQGAAWDQHWSFKPTDRPAAPTVDDEAWIHDPLDRFVLARLEAEELTPTAEADRRTLARRIALDLTGLPPDPGTLATFLDDTEEGAYERLVDRLLASAHWGEHRARYWLDAARYGDTHGIHNDNYREMYAYRDWVIKAFNENQPFNEFTVDQIAGDLLEDPTLDQLIATGLQRNNITTNEGGVLVEEYEAIYAKDRAETIGSVFLGLTVGCATCHDHKFDPVSQREFYALTAFFRNTTQYVMDGNISDPPPTLVVPRDDDRDTWYRLRAEVGELEDAMTERLDAVEPTFAEWIASDGHREIEAPLGVTSELLRLDLDGEQPAAVTNEERQPIALHEAVRIEPGPNGLPALFFGDKGSAELPPLEIDTDTPFSLAMWIYMTEAEGSYTVASQSDPHDANRGWQITLGARELSFRLRGDRAGPGRGATSISINPNNTQRLTPGEWSHIVVTHDGSGERGGLHIYRDGERVAEQGSEFFTRVEGSILTDRPFYLGRHDLRSEGKAQSFAGGGVADVRVFDRALSVEEARVISEWGAIRTAASKTPAELTYDDRHRLLLSYVNSEDEEYRRLVTRRLEIDKEWRELRRRGTVTHVMQEIPGSEAAAHVLHRGMYDQPRERVLAGTPAALPPMPEGLPRNRLGLAHWLVDEANPLTARVTVNRFWQQVFGTGLVATSEDFGAQGEVPSHPRASRLPGDGVPGVGLGRQGLLPAAGDLVDLPAGGHSHTGQAGARSPEPAALARPPFPDGRRDGARHGARRQRSPGAHDRRTERQAVPAGRPLGTRGDELEQHVPLPKRLRGQAPPAQPLHLLEARRAAALDDDLRRRQPRALGGPPRAHEHAAPGARGDERHAVRRGVAVPRPAGDAGSRRRLRPPARLRHYPAPVPALRRRRTGGRAADVRRPDRPLPLRRGRCEEARRYRRVGPRCRAGSP